MANDETEARVNLLRKLQWVAPGIVLIVAALVYAFYQDEDTKLILVGVLIFIAGSDYFIFKMLADKAENKPR